MRFLQKKGERRACGGGGLKSSGTKEGDGSDGTNSVGGGGGCGSGGDWRGTQKGGT